MVRLYTNENFPFRVASLLRDFGYDVLTVQEAGNAGQGISDEAVLAFAVEQGRAVVTINCRDFIRLHHNSASHAGIIVCTQDPDLDGQAQRIHQAISARETLTGQLIRINRPPR